MTHRELADKIERFLEQEGLTVDDRTGFANSTTLELSSEDGDEFSIEVLDETS